MENMYYQDKFDSNKYIDARQSDIVIAKGGDGTLLKAINKYRHLNKPFFGIGAGTLNFLMNESEEISDQAKYKEFNLIKVNVQYYNGRNLITETFQAFNDIMIGGDMNSFINFNVQEKDEIIGNFKGGGLIVSTAQGSTGVNKNNGGVILPLSSDMWSITGDKTNKSINYVIEPRNTVIAVESRTGVTMWIDGTNHIIENVQSVEITKGDSVVVIFNDYSKFKRKRN